MIPLPDWAPLAAYLGLVICAMALLLPTINPFRKENPVPDWYDTHNVSPDAASDTEYRDWLADNVGSEEAADFWYGAPDDTQGGDR